MAVRWLFLDMNSFFASVEQQVRPELRGRPVAVVPMDSDATCCIAASYEAKAFGITTGTNVGDAKRRCPHLRIIEAKHGPYREYHHRIVEVVGECLPIDKILSVDEMACRLWANERELPQALRLGEHIKARIKADVGEYLHCSVGLGLNPFLAKVAAEMQKPNGLVVLDDEDLPHKLYGLALTDFPGVGRAMQARFQAVGVYTTEQMYAVSCRRMRQIWGGIRGEMWWHLIRGHPVLEPPTPRRSVGHSHVLPPELRSRWGAAGVARKLLEKAAERMRCLGFQARGLSVYLRSEQGQVWQRRVRLSPCADTWTLVGVLRSLWEHPFRKPRQVSVVLWDLLRDQDVTLPLFSEAEQRLRAARAVDRLNQRFGRGTLSMASILPVHQTAAEDKVAFAKVGVFE